MIRVPPPDRRKNWTQKVKIEGQTFYACFGEHPDGRLIEIFVDAARQGTFVRGIMDALARVISVALQCDVPASELVKALRGLNYPPQGEVIGSARVTEVSSVSDWLAKEIESVYLQKAEVKPAGKVCEGSGA